MSLPGHSINREMPLHPATRGIGRRLSGVELRPSLLDSLQSEHKEFPILDRLAADVLKLRRSMALFAGSALCVSFAAEVQPKPPSQHRRRDSKTERPGHLALKMQSGNRAHARRVAGRRKPVRS